MPHKVKLTFRNKYDVNLAVYTQSSDSHLKMHTIPTGAEYMTVESVEECGEDPEILIGLDSAYCSMEQGHDGKCQHHLASGQIVRWTRRD